MVRSRVWPSSGAAALQLLENRQASGVERLELVLRVVVRRRRARRASARPRSNGQDAGQHPEQGRLAGAVRRRPAPRGRRARPRSRCPRRRRCRRTPCGCPRACATRRPVRGGCGKREADHARRASTSTPLDTVEHLDAALNLPRLGRLIAEALDEALDLGDALGLVARLRLEQLAPRLPLHQVLVVVARIDGRARSARSSAIEVTMRFRK